MEVPKIAAITMAPKSEEPKSLIELAKGPLSRTLPSLGRQSISLDEYRLEEA